MLQEKQEAEIVFPFVSFKQQWVTFIPQSEEFTAAERPAHAQEGRGYSR